jgi:hypothetical protein
MEQHPGQDPIGFEFDGLWVTRSISRVIRFYHRPLCDHLEVDTGGECPMAYVLDEAGFETLEAYKWDVVVYDDASEQMQEFIVELHLDNQENELRQWSVDNP